MTDIASMNRDRPLRQVVHLLADAIAALPSGEQAELRRELATDRRGEAGGPAFWKLAARYLEPDQLGTADPPWRDQAERRWAFVTGVLAKLGDTHRRGHSLGDALAAADVAEPRVLRLLRVEGEEILYDTVRSVVQQLASQGEPVDGADIAELVLSSGSASWAEKTRRRLARHYYRARLRAGATTTASSEGES